MSDLHFLRTAPYDMRASLLKFLFLMSLTLGDAAGWAEKAVDMLGCLDGDSCLLGWISVVSVVSVYGRMVVQAVSVANVVGC